MLSMNNVINIDENRSSNIAAQPKASKRLTEVIIPPGQNSDAVVLPLVANLSKQNQKDWVTWITNRKPTKAQLESYKADTRQLRIIHTGGKTDNRWIIWEALALGNSHTVIADSANISDQDICHMETAASIGNCQGIITCTSP